MTNAIIAAFDAYEHALSAKQSLIASGFNASEVQLTPDQNSTQSRDSMFGSDVASDSNSTVHSSGTLKGFFANLFGVHEETEHADHYAEAVRRGSFVLTVNAASDTRQEQAIAILEKFNPINIDGRVSQWKSSGWQNHDSNAAVYSDAEIANEREAFSKMDQTAIPVIQEELKVGKRAVQRGGIRIVQRVIETPVSETVSLREEHVNVERHAVSQPATAADMEALKESSFELREMGEEAVVAKTARVVEEIIVGKQVTEKQQTINDTVRRTDVEIEKLGTPHADQQKAEAHVASTKPTIPNE